MTLIRHIQTNFFLFFFSEVAHLFDDDEDVMMSLIVIDNLWFFAVISHFIVDFIYVCALNSLSGYAR